jgi:hypothetical protein
VKYEALVTNPLEQLRPICSFIEEDYSEKVFTFYENVVEKRILRTDNLDDYLLKEITTARTGRWKKEMRPDEVISYESIAHNVLAKYGYDIRHTRLPMKAAIAGRTVSALYGVYGTLRRSLRSVF